MGLELKKSKVKLIFEKQQKFIGFFCFAGRIHRSLLFDDQSAFVSKKNAYLCK